MSPETGQIQRCGKLQALGLLAILLSGFVVYGHYVAILLHPVQTQTIARSDAEAQFQKSLDYIYGRGVAQDLDKALALCVQSAKGGFAEAQFTLGDFYYNGSGGIVLQNYREAYVWYSLAALSGYKKAAAVRYEVGANLSPAELDVARQQIRDLHKLASQTRHG